MKKLFFLIFVVFFFLANPVYATEFDYSAELEEYNISSLDEKYRRSDNELMTDFSFSDTAEQFTKPERKTDTKGLFSGIIKLVNKEVSSTMQSLMQIIGICIIFSLLTNLKTSFGSSSISEAAFFVCYMVLVALLAKSFSYCVNLTAAAVNSVSLFINALSPLLASMLVSGGMVSYASAVNPLMLLSIQILVNIINNFMLPLLYIIMMLNFIGNISSVSMDRFYKLFKSVIVWTMCIALTIFVGVIGISGFSSKAIDGALAKTAKYAVGSFVPIIGGILTDTLDTIITCSNVVKSATGIAGIITITLISLTPIIKLTVISFMYRLCAGVLQSVADKRILNAIDGSGEIIGLMIAVMFIVALMFIIAIAMIIGAVPSG